MKRNKQRNCYEYFQSVERTNWHQSNKITMVHTTNCQISIALYDLISIFAMILCRTFCDKMWYHIDTMRYQVMWGCTSSSILLASCLADRRRSLKNSCRIQGVPGFLGIKWMMYVTYCKHWIHQLSTAFVTTLLSRNREVAPGLQFGFCVIQCLARKKKTPTHRSIRE